MVMSRLHLLLALVAMSMAASHAWELPGLDVEAPLIHMLRPLLGSCGQLRRHGVPCDSWRLGVEAHNVRGWGTVPKNCENYVGHYMLGKHYRRDSRVVIDEAIAYAEGLQLAGNGTEVWVLDIDETSLSNLPYYANHGFGAEPYNPKLFNEYVEEASAPALPESLRLYKKLLSLRIKVVFLTGRGEARRAATAKNLRSAGYLAWEKLLLKPEGYNISSIAFKSGERQKLQDAGYVIVGNIGDQWSDILGYPEGARTFKLPDPMYYVG